MNFIYTINPESDEPEMVIDKSIGLDENGVGIDGSQWARELMMLDSMGKKRVKVYINSQGGLVTDGYSICSAILHTKCRVDTYCRGIAASIAGVIFMCGRQRWMADYGILMFHNPFGGKNEEALEYMKNSLATLIAVRADLKVETVLAIMARTTFLDASEAIDLQLVTDIETSSGSNVGRLAPIKVKNESDEFAYEFWKESQSIFNSMVSIPSPKEVQNQIIETTMNVFKDINNKLGLMDEAGESSRAQAIDKILNSVKETEDKAAKAVKDMEDTMAKMKAEMDETSKKNKEAYDALETEYVKMKAEKDAFEKEEKAKNELRVKNEAKDMVASAVKLGKIKNDADVIAKWTAKYESDPEGIKDILDTMGVTVQAPDFSAVTDKGAGAEKRVAGVIGEIQSAEKNADYMNKLIAEKQKKFAEDAKTKRNS